MPPVQSCTRWPITILATAPASGQQGWPAANPNLQQANKREQQIILQYVSSFFPYKMMVEPGS